MVWNVPSTCAETPVFSYMNRVVFCVSIWYLVCYASAPMHMLMIHVNTNVMTLGCPFVTVLGAVLESYTEQCSALSAHHG